MSEWKEYKLGELIETISKTFKFTDDKVIFLNTSDTLEGKVINKNFFEPKKLPGQAKKTIQPNDVLYSEIRPANKRYAFVDFESSNYVVSTKLMVLRVLDEEIISPKYLYYFLTSNEIVNYLQMLAESRSGTFPQIRFEEISLLDINLPAFKIQDEIVEVISSLDDKIELNNKINQELENLAQTLFKQWFIDFEFPNENGEPYKSSGGEMVESELGEIPKGWEVKPIGDLFEFVVGGDWGKDDIDDEHSEMNYVLRGTDIPTLKSGSKNGVPYRAIKPSKLKNRQLKINDIIIEISGGSKKQPTGRTILITKEILKRLNYHAIPASFCRLIRPKNDFAEFLGVYLVKIYDEGKTWEYQNQSTGISNFQFKFFESAEILALPLDLSVIDEFNSLISGFYNLMTTNENQELNNLRDTLLPKLISGELEVADVMSEKA